MRRGAPVVGSCPYSPARLPRLPASHDMTEISRRSGYADNETLSTLSKRSDSPTGVGGGLRACSPPGRHRGPRRSWPKGQRAAQGASGRSACRLDRLYRKELDGQLDERVGPMWHFTHELQRVPRFQHIAGAAVEILDTARDHVDQLRTRMLVQRERVGSLGERDQQVLQRVVRGAHGAKGLVPMPGARALVLDIQAAACLDEEHVLFFVQAAEKGGNRDLQCLRQPRESSEAGRGLSVLDLRQHALGQAGQLGQLADGERELQPELADPLGDDRPERVLEGAVRPRRGRFGGAVYLVLGVACGPAYQFGHQVQCPPPSGHRHSHLTGRPTGGANGPLGKQEPDKVLYRPMIQGLLSVNNYV